MTLPELTQTSPQRSPLRHGTSIHRRSEEFSEAQALIFEAALPALSPIAKRTTNQLPKLLAELKTASNGWYINVEANDGTRQNFHLVELLLRLRNVDEEKKISFLRRWEHLLQEGQHTGEAGRRFDRALRTFCFRHEAVVLTPQLREVVLRYFKKPEKGTIETADEIDAFWQHLEDWAQSLFNRSLAKWDHFLREKDIRLDSSTHSARGWRPDALRQAFALMKSGAILVLSICNALGRPEDDMLRERVSMLLVLTDLQHKLGSTPSLFIDQLQRYEDRRVSNRQTCQKEQPEKTRHFVEVLLGSPQIRALRERYDVLNPGIELGDWLEAQIKRVLKRDPACGVLITAHEIGLVRYVFGLLEGRPGLQGHAGRMILSDISKKKKREILQELSSGSADYIVSTELVRPPVEDLDRRVVQISLSQHSRPLSTYPWVEALRAQDKIVRIIQYVTEGSSEELRRLRALRFRQGIPHLAAQKPEAEQTEPADNPSEPARQHDSTPSKKRSLPHPVARYFLALEQTLLRRFKLLEDPEARLTKNDVAELREMTFRLRMKAEESLINSTQADRQRFRKQLTTFFESWFDTALTDAAKQSEQERQIVLFSWEFGLLRSAAGLKRDLQGSGLFAEAFREAISRFLKNVKSEGVLEFSDSLAAKRELLCQPAVMALLGHISASPCSVTESKARISD